MRQQEGPEEKGHDHHPLRDAAEEALRESEARYRSIIEDQTELICRYLPDGRLSFVNGAYARYYGKSESELINRNFIPHIPEADLLMIAQATAGITRENPAVVFEHRILMPDGEMRWQDWTHRGIYAADGRPIEYQAVGRDITARKRAQETIRALNVELHARLQELTEAKALEEKANRAKAEFLANISHELTTPLNSIIGFSQVLLGKNFGDLNEKQRGYLENILQSGERLHKTLENIVSFVRMDVSDPDMDWEDFRLKDIVTSSLSVFRKAAANRHLTFTLDMAKEADRIIRADRGKLAQVFHNLLSNAVKFSREGGKITLRVRYQKGLEESGKDDFTEITVEDRGIGIREEDLPQLFQPFQQLEAPLTKEFAGVGMGLVLARKLIEAHGGAIRVESEYGKGTKVIFTIPVKGGDSE